MGFAGLGHASCHGVGKVLPGFPPPMNRQPIPETMKTSTTILSLVAAGAGAVLTGCVDPYYAGPSSVSTTVYRPGYTVQTLPPGYRAEVISGTRYYYHDNVYYRPQGRGYVVVESPRRHHRSDYEYGGPRRDVTVIRELPGGYTVVNHRGQRYYRAGNVYYQSRGDGYVMVRSPF